MKETEDIQDFSIFGGPLQKLGGRLGLVRGGTDTFRLGLALGLLAWGILVFLVLLQGSGQRLLSLTVIGIHVRLLVAIPLFFLGETWVAPRMAEFVRNILASGLVPETELPSFTSDVRRLGRTKDGWLAEVLALLLAFAWPLIGGFFGLAGRTAGWTTVLAQSGGKLTLINGWYLMFCLPLFRFLLLRWLWRLGLWCDFLRRLAKLKLLLVPTHPDGAAGLGFLGVVQGHFAPLVLAVSAVYAASFAENISTGTMAFEALYRLVPVILLLAAALFIGPLLAFSRKLWVCRVNGLNEYMAMAARYVQAFDRKWIRDDKASGESQLGTADMQSLADLSNSVNVVRRMRLIPADRRLAVQLTASVILPMLPLVLLKFPIDQVAVRLFKMLVGQ